MTEIYLFIAKPSVISMSLMFFNSLHPRKFPLKWFVAEKQKFPLLLSFFSKRNDFLFLGFYKGRRLKKVTYFQFVKHMKSKCDRGYIKLEEKTLGRPCFVILRRAYS